MTTDEQGRLCGAPPVGFSERTITMATSTKTLTIEGMTCSHCANAVTKALSAVAGVNQASVDLEANTATIEAAGDVADDALVAAVEEAGYKLVWIE